MLSPSGSLKEKPGRRLRDNPNPKSVQPPFVITIKGCSRLLQFFLHGSWVDHLNRELIMTHLAPRDLSPLWLSKALTWKSMFTTPIRGTRVFLATRPSVGKRRLRGWLGLFCCYSWTNWLQLPMREFALSKLYCTAIAASCLL